jgi:CheY-specific phosphatase CheX
MSKPILSIDEISKIFLNTAQKTLETATQQAVTYSSTIQKIPKVSMKPDLTCFVQFDGDYIGLVILNFSADAAYEIYEKYMLTMGIPKTELATGLSSAEVTDSIGEITNQDSQNRIDCFGLIAQWGKEKFPANRS